MTGARRPAGAGTGSPSPPVGVARHDGPERIGVAVVGAGFIGVVHVDALRRLNEDVVAEWVSIDCLTPATTSGRVRSSTSHSQRSLLA
jgi:hypothetical protein